MLWNTLLLAFKEMRRNAMRSFLTMLGNCDRRFRSDHHGDAWQGATQSVADQIASLGSDLLIVMPGQRPGAGRDAASAPRFKVADADAIRSQIGELKAVAPTASQSVTVVAGARNWNTSITGTSNDYFIAGNWHLVSGRNFADNEEHAGKAVCIIGETVRKNLFGGENPTGSEIRIKQFSCQIIGVLSAKGQASMGRDQDDAVIVPCGRYNEDLPVIKTWAP